MSRHFEEIACFVASNVRDEGPEHHELDEREEDHFSIILHRGQLCKPPLCTKKLDCFSEGVIMVLVCTQPGHCTTAISDLKFATVIVVIDRYHARLPRGWCKPRKCAVPGPSGGDYISSIEAIGEDFDPILKKLRLLHGKRCFKCEFFSTPDKNVAPRMLFKVRQDNESVKKYVSAEAVLDHSEESTVQPLNQNACEENHVSRVETIDYSKESAFQMLYLPHFQGRPSETSIPEPKRRVPPNIPSKPRPSTGIVSEETTIPPLKQRPSEDNHVFTVETIQYSREVAFQMLRKLVLPHDPSVQDPEKHVPLDTPSKTRQSAKNGSLTIASPVTNSTVNHQAKFCRGSCSVMGQVSHHFKYLSIIQLLLLSAVALSCASGPGFVEAPVSQEVAVGAGAEFRCRHPIADIIRWRVNGSLVGRSPPPDIIPDVTRDVNGSLVDTLTIIARPEYNGTEVVCVARFDNGSPDEQTEPATLLVLRNSSIVNSGGFLVSPAPLTVAVGTEAVFQCQHLNSDFVTWRINGIAVGVFPDIVDIHLSGSISSLTITARPEYDGTMVECVAGFLGSTVLDIAPASMMIQGDLASVTNAQTVSSTITWVPPPSLDLTNVDPDIAYCVEVYNITCGMRDLIISDCSVTEPSYTSDVIMDGYMYEYTITPRSNVPGARNGTADTVTDEPPEFNFTFTRLSVEDRNTTNFEAVFEYQGDPSLVPSSYMLSLEPMDDVDVNEDFVNTEATMSATSTLNVTAELQSKRLWKCKLLGIIGCPQNIIVQNETELSTHDVQNISVSSPGAGSVRVGGDFIQGSTAIGVLIITISSRNDTQYHLCRRDGNDMLAEGTISGLAGGDHKVSAFVFEESGYPFNRVATKPQSVSVMNGVESAPSSNISYDVHSNSTGVCITCTFLDSSATDCVAVVHQRISQLSSSGLMNITSYKFNRSGDTAYGCIPTNLKDYQVGVVDGRLVTDGPQEGSSFVCAGGCVAGIAAVLIILMSLVLFVAIVLLYRKMLKIRKDNAFEVSIMDGESARENHIYVDIPSTRNEVGLTTAPLIPTSRVQSDGHDAESSDTLPSLDNPLPPPTSSPPVIPQAAAGGVVYSELDRRPNPTTSAPPPQGDEPQYSTVNKFKNPQGVTYMCHVVKPSSTSSQPVLVDDSTKTMFGYSELIHRPACQEKTATTATATAASNESERPLASSPPTPCTVENLLLLLYSIASKWGFLGEALSLDEDDLDMINTNNETDEACLRDMLEFYEKKSGSQYTWEAIVTVLKKIGQKEIAEKIQGLHVEPYANPLPGQTEEIHTEGSPTCDVATEVNRPELLPHQRIDSDSSQTSGYSSQRNPSTVSTDVSSSSIISADADEGCVDAGVDGRWTHTPKEAVQPTAQDVPKKDGIVHVHNSGPKFQPKDLKKPDTFQHLDYDSPEQREIHCQCEDDVETPASMTNSGSPDKDKNQYTVVAPAEEKHHHVTVDETQDDASGRKSFLTGGVQAHISHDVFKDFPYDQDSYFKVSLGCEDHPGYDKESSCVHSTASSTIQLTAHEYAFKLRQLAEKVNVGECLWQIRAQALSQEGSQDHLSDSAMQEDCPNPETMLNKRLRVNKQSKLRINFQRFQETTR